MYRPASCTTITDVSEDQKGQDGMCALEGLRRLEVLAEGELDAIPAGAYVYKVDPITVGFFWLKRPLKRGPAATQGLPVQRSHSHRYQDGTSHLKRR